MNTPSPCNKCRNLYYNVMTEDDPNDVAECMLFLPLGQHGCPKFESYLNKEKSFIPSLTK